MCNAWISSLNDLSDELMSDVSTGRADEEVEQRCSNRA
jgi:hypothetical protein